MYVQLIKILSCILKRKMQITKNWIIISSNEFLFKNSLYTIIGKQYFYIKNLLVLKKSASHFNNNKVSMEFRTLLQ